MRKKYFKWFQNIKIKEKLILVKHFLLKPFYLNKYSAKKKCLKITFFSSGEFVWFGTGIKYTILIMRIT